MAWQISATGTREGVVKIIEAATPLTPEANTTQLARAKILLIGEVNDLSVEFNGCIINASGDDQKNGRQQQSSVLPLQIAV